MTYISMLSGRKYEHLMYGVPKSHLYSAKKDTYNNFNRQNSLPAISEQLLFPLGHFLGLSGS